MEVYIDDMLVKSLLAEQHLDHLRQAFEVLQKYGMKLNPTKCSFGVAAGKFLGYMVTQRGIEANPDQIRSIMNLQSPACIRDVQRLTGRVANSPASSHTLPRSATSSSALCASPRTSSGHQPASKHCTTSKGTSLHPHSSLSQRMGNNFTFTSQSPTAQSALCSYEKKMASNSQSTM